MSTGAPQHGVPTGAGIEPTLLSVGALGPERSRHAWDIVRTLYLENPLPLDTRVALLCAAWERPGGLAMAIHATGMSLLGQGPEMVDVERVWREMAAHPRMRAVLQTTVQIAWARDPPERAVRDVHDTLQAWSGAWEDLVAYASWAAALFRTRVDQVPPHPDPRVEAWLARLVKAGTALAVAPPAKGFA